MWFFCIPSVLNFKHKVELNELSKLRREKWTRAIKREDLTASKLKNAKVCGKHFLSGKAAELKDSTNPDWIPTLNMGYIIHKDASRKKAAERWDRVTKRHTKMEAGTSASFVNVPEDVAINSGDEVMDVTFQNNSRATQTDITMDQLSNMFIKLSATSSLTTVEPVELTYKCITTNERQCKYYTGFECSTFKILVESLKHLIPIHHNTKLPATEQPLLTFVKLRLNLDYKDLAFRFGISETVVSVYFKTTIDVLFHRFKKIVTWPSREKLKKTMPQCFKQAFQQNTSIIIDCFEIKIQTPSNPYAAAQCWSHYKHHPTVKYLIGITPQGSVSFISDGWGGRTSDKFITLQSDFLDLLHPGDVVLADRGFLIWEFVELFQATVRTPAFKKGKSQLDPVELEESRSIASVRIHVERVIGVIRQKFTILSNGVMPMSTVASGFLDKIVFVCCALVNMCPPIVPLD